MKYLNLSQLNYSLYKENHFQGRYINMPKFYAFLLENHKESIDIIGYSVLQQPIYKLTIGSGDTQILMWTQMHGNESTGTLACLDLLNFLKTDSEESNSILQMLTIDIVFILNPDGAVNWDRRNALGIDVNRDFVAEQSPEIKVLKKQFQSKNYNVCFNLHDQRSVFNVGDTQKSSTLSFLSPAVDFDRNITETRKKSMGIISHIYKSLQEELQGSISRFSDEFYPNSTGDNFQSLGVPTVLYEAGHYPNDYLRKETRKYFFKALVTALQYISLSEKLEQDYEHYEKIPNNQTLFADIKIKNLGISYKSKYYFTNVIIQYKEIINSEKEEIEFIPYIEEVGDLEKYFGIREIDVKNEIVLHDQNIVIGHRADEILEKVADFMD